MTVHILGGGPAGIALSYYLSKLNTVCCLEKQQIVGGMARSWRWSDFIVDRPHILHSPEISIWQEWTKILGEALISDDYFSANYKERYNKEFLFDYQINTTPISHIVLLEQKKKERLTVELSKDYKEFIAAASSFAEYTECLVGPLISKHFFTIYPEKYGEYYDEVLPDWAPAHSSDQCTRTILRRSIRRCVEQGHWLFV